MRLFFLLQVYINVDLFKYYYETTLLRKIYGYSTLKVENNLPGMQPGIF